MLASSSFVWLRRIPRRSRCRGVQLRQLLQLRRHAGGRSRRSWQGGRGQGLRRRLLHVDNLGLLCIRGLLLIVHGLLLGVLLRILLLVVMTTAPPSAAAVRR